MFSIIHRLMLMWHYMINSIYRRMKHHRWESDPLYHIISRDKIIEIKCWYLYYIILMSSNDYIDIDWKKKTFAY